MTIDLDQLKMTIDLDHYSHARISAERAREVIGELRGAEQIAGTFEVMEGADRPRVFHFDGSTMLYVATRGDHAEYGDTYVLVGPDAHLFSDGVLFIAPGSAS